jgi:SpoIID/LytB domain protein
MYRRALPMVVVGLLASALLPTPFTHPAAAQAPKQQKLILEPASSRTLFTFEGLYPQKKGLCDFRQKKPIKAVYRGLLELILNSDGSIEAINALSFSNYLRGLAEVPRSWPIDSLKAQAIAARSYALESLRRNASLSKKREYDICSTDQCQVYRGAMIELGAFGERWVNAVEGTKGKVLTYNGAVLPAYYFSTSDGRTRSSFPGGSPQPWLPSVSGEDAKAPLAHWTARIRLTDLTAILRTEGDWKSTASITRVARTTSGIQLSGGGTSRTATLTDFRNSLNNEAPCEFPKRYPTQDGASDGSSLPQTVPSETFTISQSGGTVIISGRGWGHGVGMSQWGARYMAGAGDSSTTILKHFYGPARVTAVKEPGQIRVLAAQGLRAARISIDGPVHVRTETGSVLAPGTKFEVTGGKVFTIRRGIGPKLKPVLTIVPTVADLASMPGETLTVAFTTSRSARVSVVLHDGDTVLAQTKSKSLVSGVNQLALPLVGPTGLPVPPGKYELLIRGYDGLDHVVSTPIAVTLAAPTPIPTRAPQPTGSQSRAWFIAVAAVLAVGLAGFLFRRRVISRT